MIYTVTTKRMQTWTHRIKANSADEAKEIGDDICGETNAHDDYAYDTTASPSKDQSSDPDNAL